jgi:hypothetical protein
MDNTQELIDKLTSAISFKFKDDPTSPGLTISRLRHGYYCSVIRYTGSVAKGKIVVCKVKADSLESALHGVAQEFLTVANVQRDPLQELGDMVRGSATTKPYMPKVGGKIIKNKVDSSDLLNPFPSFFPDDYEV